MSSRASLSREVDTIRDGMTKKSISTCQAAVILHDLSLASNTMYPDGISHLSKLAEFVESSSKPEVMRILPSDVRCEIEWWHWTLHRSPRAAHVSPLLLDPKPMSPVVDLGIWVDASAWGIGLIAKNQWAAWEWMGGTGRHDSFDCHVGELFAIEVSVWWIAAQHLHDVKVLIRSDSRTAEHVYQTGRSWSGAMKASIKRIGDLTHSHKLCLIFQHVSSAENLADPISRGKEPAYGLSRMQDIFEDLPSALLQCPQRV